MSKFIKLTERINNELTTLVINTEYLKSVKLGKHKVDTLVTMTDGHYFFVKESVAQVEEMLCVSK